MTPQRAGCPCTDALCACTRAITCTQHTTALFEAACLLPWSGTLSKAAQHQTPAHVHTLLAGGPQRMWPDRRRVHCATFTPLLHISCLAFRHRVPNNTSRSLAALPLYFLPLISCIHRSQPSPSPALHSTPNHHANCLCVCVCRDIAEEHYKDLSSKPFFPALVEYILSGPVVCMVSGGGRCKSGRWSAW